MIKFYLNGDANQLIYLEEEWLQGEYLQFCDRFRAALEDKPGKARVSEFFKMNGLVPAEGEAAQKILSVTSDYNQFFIKARSLGTQLRIAGVPESVVERAIQELKASSDR